MSSSVEQYNNLCYTYYWSRHASTSRKAYETSSQRVVYKLI